jgi:hypothetical protein
MSEETLIALLIAGGLALTLFPMLMLAGLMLGRIRR